MVLEYTVGSCRWLFDRGFYNGYFEENWNEKGSTTMMAKFNNVINSTRPVLVDFYADWCGPCKQMPAILKQVKDELKEQVRIIKVDVDRNPLIATKYQIRSIPTLMLFKEGELIWTGMGVRSANEIKRLVKQQIASS